MAALPGQAEYSSAAVACLGCRRIKVRCVFPASGACARCARLGLPCEVRPHRRGRRGSPTRVPRDGSLQSFSGSPAARASVPQDAARLSSWSPVLNSPSVLINALLARSEAWNFTSQRSTFSLPDDDHLPHLDPVSLAIITFRDAERLFRRFHTHLHCWAFLNDPVSQTADNVRAQSTFLFTVICAISSIFCPLSRASSQRLVEHANHMAGVIMTSGYKSIEIAQAFAVLALYYPQPTSTLTDRSWSYFGYGCRMLLELGGDQHFEFGDETLDPEAEYRKRLSARTYIALYLCDVSLSTHWGRTRMFAMDKTIVQRALRWTENSNLGEFDKRLPDLLQIRHVMETAAYEDPSKHKRLIAELESCRARWSFNVDGYQNYFYQHIKLILTMSPVGVATMGQEEDDLITHLVYTAAHESVHHSVAELSDGGSLRFAHTHGIHGIMYAATILFKMVSISDPGFLATQSHGVIDLLKDLSEAMLIAAAHRNDSHSLMEEYGQLLQTTVERVDVRATPGVDQTSNVGLHDTARDWLVWVARRAYRCRIPSAVRYLSWPEFHLVPCRQFKMDPARPGGLSGRPSLEEGCIYSFAC